MSPGTTRRVTSSGAEAGARGSLSGLASTLKETAQLSREGGALWAAALDSFAQSLAELLRHRTPSELRRRGLQADDLRWKVQVELRDGSKLTFERAVAAVDFGYVGVFTRSCGCVVFDAGDVSSVQRDDYDEN